MKFVLATLLLLSVSRGTAQDSLHTADGYHWKNNFGAQKTLATGAVAAITLTSMYDAYNTWWKGANKPFTFYTENWFGGHLGLDKPGHFFGTYTLFKVYHNFLLWGGYSRSTSLWWAAGLAMWNGFQIEVGDGMSPYGFDYQDLLFDMGGVAYGMLQSEVPVLQNFNFKFSYWSKKGFTSPANFTQDYDAMTIWLAVNVHNLLPTSMERYWPEWLQIALGFGVGDHETKREGVIALDLNFEAFKTENDNVRIAEKLLDLMHVPAPAVKFTERTVPKYYLFHLY